MRGKLIIIEGTDCSGKETQTNALFDRLNKENIVTKKFGFPWYDSPTGKIIGGPFLGKKEICEGWFPEEAPNVDANVASLYYAADRKYNIHKVEAELASGNNVILDRYTYSNMAHQGGKIFESEKRYVMYQWLEKLEFDFLALPKPDICIFLHMPYEATKILKQAREEKPDQNESDEAYMKNAEKAYIEVAARYNFKTIDGSKNMNSDLVRDDLKRIDEISDEIYEYVISQIRSN
jgi:dTMP kinase